MTALQTLFLGIDSSFFVSILVGYIFLRPTVRTDQIARLVVYGLLIATAGIVTAVVAEFFLAGTRMHYTPVWLLNLAIYCNLGTAGLLFGISFHKGGNDG